MGAGQRYLELCSVLELAPSVGISWTEAGARGLSLGPLSGEGPQVCRPHPCLQCQGWPPSYSWGGGGWVRSQQRTEWLRAAGFTCGNQASGQGAPQPGQGSAHMRPALFQYSAFSLDIHGKATVYCALGPGTNPLTDPPLLALNKARQCLNPREGMGGFQVARHSHSML